MSHTPFINWLGFVVLLVHPFKIILNALHNSVRFTFTELSTKPLVGRFIMLAAVAPTGTALSTMTERNHIGRNSAGAIRRCYRYPVIGSDNVPQSASATAYSASIAEVFLSTLPLITRKCGRQRQYSATPSQPLCGFICLPYWAFVVIRKIRIPSLGVITSPIIIALVNLCFVGSVITLLIFLTFIWSSALPFAFAFVGFLAILFLIVRRSFTVAEYAESIMTIWRVFNLYQLIEWIPVQTCTADFAYVGQIDHLTPRLVLVRHVVRSQGGDETASLGATLDCSYIISRMAL